MCSKIRNPAVADYLPEIAGNIKEVFAYTRMPWKAKWFGVHYTNSSFRAPQLRTCRADKDFTSFELIEHKNLLKSYLIDEF